MSVAEIVRRCRQLVQETGHLRKNLPHDNPHARILRLNDIAAYIGLALNTLHRVAVNEKCAPMPQSTQIALSRFFYGWDHGHLVKAKLADRWIIVNPHACERPLSQVVTAASAKADARSIAMRIDMTTLGPKLKGA